MHKICKKLIPEEDNFHHTSGQLRAVPPTDNFQVRVMFKLVHDQLKAERESRGDTEVNKYDLPEEGNKIRFTAQGPSLISDSVIARCSSQFTTSSK